MGTGCFLRLRMLRKDKTMRREDIAEEKLVLNHNVRSSKLMLENEIPESAVYHHVLPEGDTAKFMADGTYVRVLFLCSGSVRFLVEGAAWSYSEKAYIAAAPDQNVEIQVQKNADILEIRWNMNAADKEEIKNGDTVYPVTGKYTDALQYRDPFKSEKTISRAILPQRTVPRFAMGTVETYGDDLIGQHAHPLLDQYFFGFPENDVDLLIDDITYPMGGNSLIHIPLGSNHGVSVKGKQVAHYLWIDFIQDPEKANRYLDEVHKPTGSMRSFQEEA